jgi:hypothetical protein
MISLSIKSSETQICFDTKCSVTLTNRKFVKVHESHYIIRRIITSLNVRKLEINKHEIFEYIIIIIYFIKIIDEKFVRELIRRKIYLINDFKINMLIENDILDFEEIFVNDVNDKIIIFSCNNMIIFIEIKILSKKMIKKIMHTRCSITISSRLTIIISIHNTILSFNREFLFESNKTNVFYYAHIINSFINSIMTKNDSDHATKVLRNARLQTIIEIQYSNAF